MSERDTPCQYNKLNFWRTKRYI